MFLRNKISYLAIGAIAIVFLAGILFFGYKKNDTPVVKAAASQNVRGFAWSENIGWISFNSMGCDTNGNGFYDDGVAGCLNDGSAVIPYGVTLDLGGTNNLSGYAWSENIGWISFNRMTCQGGADQGEGCFDNSTCDSNDCRDTAPGAAGNPPGAPYNGAETYIAKLDGSNNLTGWARALSNGGGWDGWIRLSNTPAYGVTLNGTDFEGFAWSDMVVGWVSFNSKNCDIDGNNFIDAGDCGGIDNATKPVNNYKVYLANISYAENFTGSNPAYCSKPAQFSLQWTYRNTSGVNQDQYHIQVATDPGFTSFVVDAINPQAISPNGTGTAYLTVVSNPTPSILDMDIGYNSTTYYLRLQVHSLGGNWSGWTTYDDLSDSDNDGSTSSFTTEEHEYPTVDFSPPPPTGYLINTQIQFCSNDNIAACSLNTYKSVCYGVGVTCVGWLWNFGDQAIVPFDPIEDIKENPFHSYTVADSYDLTLEVTDSDGKTCSNLDNPSANPKTLGAKQAKWKEVIPISE